MKKIWGILLLAAVLTGCRSNYDITTTSGMKIVGVSKPKLDRQGNFYFFKDAAGNVCSLPSSRVSVIEPTGSSTENQFDQPKMRRPKK